MNDIGNSFKNLEMPKATSSRVLMNLMAEVNSSSSAAELMRVIEYYSRCILDGRSFEITEDPYLNAWLKEVFTSATLAQKSIKEAFINGKIDFHSDPIDIAADATATQVAYYQFILMILRIKLVKFNKTTCQDVLKTCDDIMCDVGKRCENTCDPLTAMAA